ncbi:uncharacterized protein LOC110881599 [Helianthus annuus]|uniref:uncharacterized protein LOC110881599 n=1 Tax=Helianthus annuus TaxID=4232 RepID=UPI000B9052A9|nr:uncharacterized protein LOC110881599 [Helianthus annuus]
MTKYLYWTGYVEVCFNLQDTTKKDGSKGKRLNLRVEDLEGQKCPVTLWDAFAIDMFSYMNDKKRVKHVILCHFIVNLYKGKRGFANGFELSRLFIDTYIEEISSFRKSVEDEFLNNPDFMLIGFLGTILKTKKVLVLGTITAICTDKLWYYNGCNYYKSSVEEIFVTKENVDGSCDVDHTKALVCTNNKCEGVDIYSIPRFKIPIRVQDSSGTVSLTLFDYEAYKIFKKSAKELLAIEDPIINTCIQLFVNVVNSGEIPNQYPEIFDTLVGKKYAFIINIKDYNIEHQVENYGIAMATNNDEILVVLYAKFNLNQHEQSKSFGVLDSYSLSTPFDLIKDEMSCSGDNVTPISKALVGNKNPSSDETKRNLREVCEVDDALGCSSTKRRMSDELVQDEDVGVSKLLIPKIEK